MAASAPGVSVIIAAKDAAATIARAVASALQQPEARQVLVIDDGSTDDTADLARACAPNDTRLEIHRLAENVGPAAARNIALQHAREDFITVLDADDFMLPGRLARLLSAAEDVDLVADDLALSDELTPLELEGRLLGLPCGYSASLSLAGFAEGNISRPGRSRREMGFMKPLIRRRFLAAADLSYDPSLRLGEDYILYATALARGAQARLVAATGYVAVRSRNSLSGSHSSGSVRAFHCACEGLSQEVGRQGDGRAVARHAASVRKRVTHLDVLEQRRASGSLSALRLLLKRGADIPYVLTQTLRDKLSFRGAR